MNIEDVRQAIIKKTGEDPDVRFRIIHDYGDGYVEVHIVWDEYDSEVRTVKVK